MRFEHLLQVTDPADPRVPPMSRAELWRGLMARVEAPQRFPLGPDRCEAEPDGAGLRRRIHFGALRFEDTVTLEPERRIAFVPQPHEGAAPIALTITVEEPTPGALFLRFVYRADAAEGGADAALQRCREQAWLEMDRDMLRTLRAWQAEARL
mgnify:CR=1 FL=1